MALPWNFCVLIFETFLGGALWHNVYRGVWGAQLFTVVWPAEISVGALAAEKEKIDEAERS